MLIKHSNIFWHEGVKIFEGRMLDSATGRLRVRHLENDVTKSLLNLFEHCSPAVLKTFLRLVGVKDNPSTFACEFQVSNTNTFRSCERRIMLSVVADSTQRISDPSYDVRTSRPDGALYNENTAILIEVKTQSPLIEEQIESHVKHYLGTATQRKILTWEDISEAFRQLLGAKAMTDTDLLLLRHFVDFLELLGIARFDGIGPGDFETLGAADRMTQEDYLDFKRQFQRKVKKGFDELFHIVRDEFDFKPLYSTINRSGLQLPGSWYVLYFSDTGSEGHVNAYPNINFNIRAEGIELSVNAEIVKSRERILRRMREQPEQFEAHLQHLPDMRLALYSKLQYQPMDNFVWKLLPGYPVAAADVRTGDILSELKQMAETWLKFRHTILFEMESYFIRHESGRNFKPGEIAFAAARNKRLNSIIRLEKRFPASEIARTGRRLPQMLAKDVLRLKPLMSLLVGE